MSVCAPLHVTTRPTVQRAPRSPMKHQHIRLFSSSFFSFSLADATWIIWQQRCSVVLCFVYGLAEWRASRSRTLRCNKEAAAAESAYHWSGEASRLHSCCTTTPPCLLCSAQPGSARLGSARLNLPLGAHVGGKTQQREEHAAAPTVSLTHPTAAKQGCSSGLRALHLRQDLRAPEGELNIQLIG